jgi:hypothetical protein
MAAIRCPHCATVFQLTAARPGAVTECPRCKRPCRLPAGKPADSPTISAAPPPPAPAPPAARDAPPAPPEQAPTGPILHFDPEQAIPSLEIDSDPWSDRPPTQAKKHEERWRAIDPHPRKPSTPVPASPPVVPSLELDAEPPPSPLGIDFELSASPPASGPAGGSAPAATAFSDLGIPLLGAEMARPVAEEEMIELPAECVEDAPPPPEAVPVVQGVEGAKPPEALVVVQGVLAEEAEELEEVAEEIEEVGEVPEYEDFADAPRQRAQRRPPRRKRSGQGVPIGSLEKVSLGLGFHYARIAVLVVAIILSFMSFVPFVSAVASFLLQIVTPPLGYIGSILCLWMPRQTGARGLILGSLILDLTSGFLGLVLFVVAFIFPIPAIALLLALPTFALNFASWILFMLTLRRLCLSLRDEGMANEATDLLIRGIIMLILSPMLLGLVLLLATGCFLILSIPILITLLYFFFSFFTRQLDLVGSIRQVIATRW